MSNIYYVIPVVKFYGKNKKEAESFLRELIECSESKRNLTILDINAQTESEYYGTAACVVCGISS